MRTKTILFYGLAALMAGCVPIFSLHPLASPDRLAFEERLTGVWVDDGNTTWEFTRATASDANALPDGLDAAGDRFYRLDFRDDGRRAGAFLACLVRLGDDLFLDIFPRTFPSGEVDIEATNLPYNGLFFIRAHTFIRVQMSDDEVEMHRTDDETFEKLLAADPNAIAFTAVDDRVVLTASTEALQAFVAKHAEDGQLFTSEITLTRRTSD